VYRIRSQAVALGVAATLGLLLGVVAIVGPGPTPASIVVGGAIILAAVIGNLRAATAKLTVDDVGATIRNPFRTVFLPWEVVAKIEMGRYKLLGDVLIFHRIDGQRFPVFAVEGITGQPRRRTSIRARAMTAELNERLLSRSPSGMDQGRER
jgi:hypothetical protein